MSVLEEKRTYRSAEDRREQILDCALGVFSEAGYHQTSIADICARAGIGRATLYQYFQDKRDVLRALADRVTSKVVSALNDRPALTLSPDALPSEEAVLAFLEHRFVTVLESVFEDAPTARLVLRTGRGADGVADELLGRIERTVLALTEADLREAQRVGLVRPIDVRIAAKFLFGGIEKVVMTSLDEDQPVDLPALAREAAMLQMYGLLARRTRHEAPIHSEMPKEEEER
jgi:AcrR family transcriptional regulator